MKQIGSLLTALLLAPLAFAAETAGTTSPQWHEVELTFTATRDAANPYTDTEAWADFTHEGMACSPFLGPRIMGMRGAVVH